MGEGGAQRHWRGFIPYNDNYHDAAACEDWRGRFPDVSPPPWDEPIDEWVLKMECYPQGQGGDILLRLLHQDSRPSLGSGLGYSDTTLVGPAVAPT